MKKLMISAVALALTVGVAAPAANAAPSTANTPGGACVQAGLATLKSLGLLQAAAQKQVNYALIDSNGPGIPSLGLPGGLIKTDLGDEAFLSLGQVVSLHAHSPQLFAWC